MEDIMKGNESRENNMQKVRLIGRGKGAQIYMFMKKGKEPIIINKVRVEWEMQMNRERVEWLDDISKKKRIE